MSGVRAPTDPYVLALEHTVPQIRDAEWFAATEVESVSAFGVDLAVASLIM